MPRHTTLAIVSIAAATLMTLATQDAQAGDIIDHAPLTKLLGAHVDARGRVDYEAIRKNPDTLKALDAYLSHIARAKAGAGDAALAFYINAYNATVIRGVLADRQTSGSYHSVLKIDGFFKKTKHTIAGRQLTLDELEHKLIRPQFKDARVHFVLVCGATDCPRLRQQAMTHANVKAQLDRAAREYIPKATRATTDGVQTSQLFNWFADDFKRDAGSVPAFLARYTTDDALKARLADKNVKLSFSEYDWALNIKK